MNMGKNRRLQTVQTALMIAAIIKTKPDKWWSANEVFECWKRNVGGKSCRTILRHLDTLEEAGTISRKGKQPRQFKWIGYPSGFDLTK